MREPLLMEMPSLLEALGKALRPYLDQPYALFGHSLGALISFEFACHCRRWCNRQPNYLFFSGRQAPHIPDPSPLHALPEQAFLRELKRLNGTPKAVLENPEMMQLLIPILRADLAIDETYEYRSELPLEAPITVFGGEQDSEVNRVQLEAWRQYTSANYSLQMFPGDHFFVDTARSSLLQVLSRQLGFHYKKLE